MLIKNVRFLVEGGVGGVFPPADDRTLFPFRFLFFSFSNPKDDKIFSFSIPKDDKILPLTSQKDFKILPFSSQKYFKILPLSSRKYFKILPFSSQKDFKIFWFLESDWKNKISLCYLAFLPNSKNLLF